MQTFAAESWAQFLRWAWQLKRRPMFLVMSLSQPLMWLLMFGPAMRAMRPSDGGMDYLAFMVPGLMAFTVFGSAMMAGIPILFDKESGFLTRLMASPASRGSILVGRALYTVLNTLAQALLILAVGWLMSDGMVLSVASVGYVLGLTALLTVGLTVLSLALAFKLKHHAMFFVLISTLGMPVMFLSNALFELAKMPGWMRYAALANPMTYAISGMRGALDTGVVSAPWLTLGALLVFNALAFTVSYRVCSRALA